MEQFDFYQTKLNYEIDSWDLSEMLKSSNNVIVVDTRTTVAFALEHIPGSINVPHRTMSEKSTRDFDEIKIYVTYCDGIGCNASTKGSLNMSKLGFNVKELLEGLDWWKRDGHETAGTNKAKDKSTTCGC